MQPGAGTCLLSAPRRTTASAALFLTVSPKATVTITRPATSGQLLSDLGTELCIRYTSKQKVSGYVCRWDNRIHKLHCGYFLQL
jgi:hypothetical protein